MLLLLLILTPLCLARGRYEYIEEADLPAFYSLRSAQLAQQAVALQQSNIPPQQYLSYAPYYQQYGGIDQASSTSVVQYSPFIPYSQYYRPVASPPVVPQQPRVQYAPVTYIGSVAKAKQKAVRK